MSELALALDTVIGALRLVLFVGVAALAGLVGLAWVVRRRRLSPFGPVARFVRGTVDPLFVPMERRIVRAGGQPAAAPWWTLAAVAVGGIVLLAVLGFVRDQLVGAMAAVASGPQGILVLLVRWTFAILQLALIARVVASWVRVSPSSPWLRWAFVLTEWILRPLRQVVPSVGMLDVTPIVAYFALHLLERVVLAGIT